MSLHNGEMHENLNYLKEAWKLIPEYHKTRGFAREHILSFNNFIEKEIHEIVKSNCLIESDIRPNWIFRYANLRIEPPSIREGFTERILTPHECRLRDLTYCSRLVVDVEYIKGDKLIIARDRDLGTIPIMLKSSLCTLNNKTHQELCAMKECPMDPGGYFIIKGVERVVLMQEQTMSNRIIIDKDKDGGLYCTVVSVNRSLRTRTYLLFKKSTIYVQNSIFKEEVPLSIVFKALGCDNDQMIAGYVGGDFEVRDELLFSLRQAYELEVYNEYDALKYLNTRLKNKDLRMDSNVEFHSLRMALSRQLISHVKVEKFNFRNKLVYLAYMTRTLILAKNGKIKPDDLDYYGNKRIELPGTLIAMLFEDVFKRLNSMIKKAAENTFSRPKAKTFEPLTEMRPYIMTEGLTHPIASGKWLIKRFSVNRHGVTQVLSRLSYISVLGMMTKVNSLFEKTRKISGPRSLQPSSWGMLCPCDTPEGEGCGLIKNLAFLAHITPKTDENIIIDIISRSDCVELGPSNFSRCVNTDSQPFLVILNGQIFGIVSETRHLAHQLRKLRRNGILAPTVSVSVNHERRCLLISSDVGRICRPYIIVEKSAPNLTKSHLERLERKEIDFDFLLSHNVIEYLDVNEENNALIATDVKKICSDTTHMEIACCSIIGCCASLIPFINHNQSPRNTYQSAMCKQAISTPAFNQNNRSDTLINVLVYPQSPMVKTRNADLLKLDDVPYGQNAILAVMSYSGYDIEDAIIMNKDSIDRGYGRSIAFRKHQLPLQSYANGSSDRLQTFPACVPQKKFPLRYGATDCDGLVGVGSRLIDRTVLMCKSVPTNALSEIIPQRGSTNYKIEFVEHNSNFTVITDRVLVITDKEGHKSVKVMTCETRRPEIGDKFSSRHAQKGVIGFTFSQADLPFTESGVVPDIIMNPHGLPSRMTVGKLLELIVGKAGLVEGKRKYGTAFEETRLEECCNLLQDNGYAYQGHDLLALGSSGELIDCYIFMGPVHYQKLKHMVCDKMHARGVGPHNLLTRQPTEGRARDGGLRVGEMERDCFVSYGASSILVERLMISSDLYTAYVCRQCGLLAFKQNCTFCNSAEELAEISIPYACKLLLQELMCMNIIPKLDLKEKQDILRLT